MYLMFLCNCIAYAYVHQVSCFSRAKLGAASEQGLSRRSRRFPMSMCVDNEGGVMRIPVNLTVVDIVL